jgi:transcription initiation factor TFIIH subunit 4
MEGNVVLTVNVAKCFVMALLYLKDPLPTADLEVWVNAESKK